MLFSGTMNAPEGIRLVMATCGILLTLYAAIFAHNGSMAFASPIRKRMVLRRRIQMFGYLAIFLVIGGQTMSAASVPDPPVITAAGIAVSYMLMTVMGILLVLTLMFSIGWAGTQLVVGPIPLQPDVDQALTQASLEARDILHESNNGITLAIGTIDLVIHDDTAMTVETRDRLLVAVQMLTEAASMQDQAHALIRSQTAAVVPPKGA